MFQFIVQVGFQGHNYNNEVFEYNLSKYSATSTLTAFGALKRDALAFVDKQSHVYWMSVSLVYMVQNTPPQVIYSMKGDKTWFEGVEYFRKFMGDMGGSIADEPLSHGFIDQVHNIRVEFEQGIVQIRGL